VRLLRGELRKLVRRPAAYVTLGIELAIVVIIYIAVAARFSSTQAQTPTQVQERAGILLLITFPTAYGAALAFVTGLGGLLAMAFAAAAAGGDWGWGMVKVAVARGESRSRYILAKLLGVEAMLVLGFGIAFGVALGAAVAAGRIAGIPATGFDDAATLQALPGEIWRGYLGIAEQASIGFAVATLARSQLAGLGAGIAIYFAEQFATLFLPDVVKYLPFHVATAALGVTVSGGGGGAGPGGGSSAAQLDQPTAFLLVVAYLIGAAVVSALFVERAEISG
jgi:ABC-type transport system involved in multi-copper enzyme maturation permease subunit